MLNEEDMDIQHLQSIRTEIKLTPFKKKVRRHASTDIEEDTTLPEVRKFPTSALRQPSHTEKRAAIPKADVVL